MLISIELYDGDPETGAAGCFQAVGRGLEVVHRWMKDVSYLKARELSRRPKEEGTMTAA